jgi:tRNA G18 (ribose-2'-O)-methylase SpoU
MKPFQTSSLSSFLRCSVENWTIIGTDLHAPKSKLRYIDPRFDTPSILNSPTILVVGSEGKGLGKGISQLCDFHLLISKQENVNKSFHYQVDSLNVSVATGILINKILEC